LFLISFRRRGVIKRCAPLSQGIAGLTPARLLLRAIWWDTRGAEPKRMNMIDCVTESLKAEHLYGMVTELSGLM
jgi:hypothetical protein